MKQQENIKYQISIGVFVALCLFLIFNLVSSQAISPLYFQFVGNNKNSAIDLLEKIKKFPEFQKILEMNKNIYGITIEKEVYRQENDEISMINNLEQQLRINPKAKDILYRLYLLYKEKGNNLTAEKYLKQAQELDPTLK